MTAENFENSLRALSEAIPFRLFTIELKSGLRFEVDSPSALAMRGGVAVFVSPGGVPILFDHETVSMLFPAKADTSFKAE